MTDHDKALRRLWLLLRLRESRQRMDEMRAEIERLREEAVRGPLGVDISDYSDDFCAGFLAGQVNALDALAPPGGDDA